MLEFIQRQQIPPPIVVTPDTTLETVILKLAATKAHRVWVVSDMDTCRLEGLISLGDLMKLLDLRVYIDQQPEIE